MKNKVLHNPTNSDILDYRIAEAKTDSSGNIMRDNQGYVVSTDMTLEWSLAGELSRNKEELERKNIFSTMEFPEYVADYLSNIYGFLEEREAVEVKDPVEEEKVEDSPVERVAVQEAPSAEEPTCKVCKKTFKSFLGLGAHMDQTHYSKKK